MITYNSDKCNNLEKKISEILKSEKIDTYDFTYLISENVTESIVSCVQECFRSFGEIAKYECPKCHKTHLVVFNSSYSRNVVLIVNNLKLKVKVSVSRAKCENCGSTHAFLPEICVPFKQSSRLLILEVVRRASKTSINKVANSLDIDTKQVRRYINLVKSAFNITERYYGNFNEIFLYVESKRAICLNFQKLST